MYKQLPDSEKTALNKWGLRNGVPLILTNIMFTILAQSGKIDA